MKLLGLAAENVNAALRDPKHGWWGLLHKQLVLGGFGGESRR
jgi:hypothetical protein